MRGWAIRAVLPALASAALLSACFPPIEASACAWIALAPMLASIARGASGAQARAMGLLFGLAIAAWSLPWLVSVFGAAGAAFWILFASFPAIALGTLAAARDRWGAGVALALAAPVWIGIELFRAEIWPLRFGWLSLGYALAASDVWAQAADLGGVYGLALATIGCSAALASAAAHAERAARARAIGAALAIPLVLAGYGAHRLAQPLETPDVPVALLQYETQSLDDAIRLAADVPAGTRLIVAPEIGAARYHGALTHLDAPETAAAIAALARDHDAVVVIGGTRDAPGDGALDGFWNSLAIVTPDGEAIHVTKAEPVPLFADGAPSDRVAPVDTPLGRIGAAICYDATHPHVIEQLAPEARLLVIASGDLASWGELQHAQHARMVRLRAIEHRRWIARATSSGHSQVIDPHGAIRAHLGYAEVGVVESAIALRDERTLRDAIGPVIPWASLAIAIVVLALVIVPRRVRSG